MARLVFFIVAGLVWAAPLTHAQSDRAPTVRQTFAPEDFQRFAPRTALDMARQVPGFSITENEGERGFGQADTNVLINGRRISGKSNGPVDALGRISAGDVVRIEIVDGASLDISGLSGQVLNVVTASAGGISGRFRYSPEFRDEGTPFRWGNGEVSLSGGGPKTEWTLSLASNQERFGEEGPELVFDGAGALIDVRRERTNEYIEQPRIAGSYTRTGDDGGVINLTGEANGFAFTLDEISERVPADGPANVRRLRETEDEYNFEVGGDYEFGLGTGRLKLIGIHRFESSPTAASVDFEFADARPRAGSVFTRQADEAESVLRSEYTLRALGGDWQWTLEGAQNYLDIDADLQVRDGAGVLQPQDFAGSSSRVEEDRAETIISYGRPLTADIQLQASVGAEYSQIRQSGEFGQTRDFVRPKGLASLNWKAGEDLNVSLQAERVVGQLNFFDVIATVNVNQGRVNVTNADLVPPQSWLFDLELQQSLGAFGSVTLSAFYEDISDIVDLVPIEGGGQAPGNIDSAMRYGGALNLTLLSDPAGWKGARLDLTTDLSDSRVRDPLTGETRRISNEEYLNFEATLRQDFEGTDWAVGISTSYEEDNPSVRLDEISIFEESFAFTEVFVEHKDVFGLTVRATAGNIFDRDNDFSRTVFNDRLSGDVAFREDRFRNFGTLFTIDIEGSF